MRSDNLYGKFSNFCKHRKDFNIFQRYFSETKVICRNSTGEIYLDCEKLTFNSVITLLDCTKTKAARSNDNNIEWCALIQTLSNYSFFTNCTLFSFHQICPIAPARIKAFLESSLKFTEIFFCKSFINQSIIHCYHCNKRVVTFKKDIFVHPHQVPNCMQNSKGVENVYFPSCLIHFLSCLILTETRS